MKIVVVSAHYPPNFVSGGTLQAQRAARGLRQRGHDVSVYAGWLGDERRPLEVWTETDETGLPVRWVVTTPWTSWDDDRNWDNRPVDADFAAYLAEERPDLVHFHSLQSLGAGLVTAAAQAGSPVVVTMHDFWWFCARQFLVDRDMHPCSLVVDAGTCPCQRDRAWLARRNRALRRILGSVDLVLAPSASAARVLAANGVEPGCLAVDENGLPVSPAGGTTAADIDGDAAAGPVRLLYVGGPNLMKGVHVLFGAVRELAGLQGWRLTAHDAESYVRSANVPIEGLPVELAPPFDPGSADQVYAGADVLVIPSVMRESFSLVAREALTRGVPVVCTDTLGPEEVVVHDHNGLVVPAADAAALARALRRLVTEPDLLPRLRAGCGDVSVRSLDDQLDGLDSIFRTLAPARREGRSLGRVLFVCGIDGAPLRYRAHLPAESLALLGVHSDVIHYREPEAPELAARADAVVFYRVPATVQVLELIDRLRGRETPTFFDVDDLIFDPDLAGEIPALELLPPDEAALWLEGVRRYRTTMEACDVFVGSTAPLCRHAAAVTGMPVRRFDNGVGMLLAQLSDRALARPRQPGPVRIGYFSGTTTHDLDWMSIEPAVAEVLGRHRQLELWLVGYVNVSTALDPFRSRIRRHSFRAWQELPSMLRDIDVNLVPLVLGGRFNEAKSAIKWLEAAQTETPTIASPTEPLAGAIRPGENGLLAAEPEEWADALDRLVADAELRGRLGRRARRDALLSLSPHLQGRRYLDILELGSDSPTPTSARRREASWPAVAHDEPPVRLALQPYRAEIRLSADGDGSARRRIGRLAAKAWSSWRTQGSVTTARRIAGYSRRQFDDRVRPVLERRR